GVGNCAAQGGIACLGECGGGKNATQQQRYCAKRLSHDVAPPSLGQNKKFVEWAHVISRESVASRLQGHKDTKAQRHKERPLQWSLKRPFFVSLCLCVFVSDQKINFSANWMTR